MQSHRKNNNVNPPDPSELPVTKPPTKEYTWRDPWLQLHVWQRMALSGINRRRGPWSCESSIPQCKGMLGSGSKSGWFGEQAEGGGIRGFSEGKPGKRISFEM